MNDQASKQTLVPPPAGNPDPRVLATLVGTDAAGDRRVALKTRRAVFNAVAKQRADREHERRNVWVALLLTGALALALAPALWAGMDAVLGGENLLDLPGMMIALGAALSAAVAAALFLISGDVSGGGRSPERPRNGRR